MNVIVEALSFGAIAVSTGALEASGADAYRRLREAVQRFVSPGEVASLEEKPRSEGRRSVVAEELEEAGKGEDVELAELAGQLMAALEVARTEAGDPLFSFEDVEAVNVRLKRIRADRPVAQLKRTKLSGDFEAEDIDAGMPPSGNPKQR